MIPSQIEVLIGSRRRLILAFFLDWGEDILTTPVFDRPLFCPDIIILFENLHGGRKTFSNISQEIILKILLALVVTGVNTE